MCNCLFCGQEMEGEEKLVDFHVCPPDQSISLNSVRVAMNEIFEKEEDGWSAWASLVDWLDSQSAQHSVERMAERSAATIRRAEGERVMREADEEERH